MIENLIAGLKISAIGLAGVFAVLILFFAVTKGLLAYFNKFYPGK